MRTSPTQFHTLVRFMEVYGDLSVTYGMGWRKLKQWEKLASLLNKDSTYGDPKSTHKWRKVWSDLKNNTKKKLIRITNAKKTGQTPHIKFLNALEKRVLRVMADTKTLLKIMENVDKTTITAELIQKHWAALRAQRKKTGSIEVEAIEMDKVDLASSSQELSLNSDHFVSVKNEQSWEFPDENESEEGTDKEMEAAEVPQGMTSPIAESTSSIMGLVNEINEPQSSQAPKQDREEELHKLRVAEKVWVLKTLRERHATAHLEREKAQLERDKVQFECEKAQFEREKAQYERDAAQILRDKAQYELNRTVQENETNTFYNK